MFSRRLFKTSLLLVTISVWLASCSDYLNEKKQEPQTLELSNERFACLKSLPERMSQYLEGGVDPRDIRNGFDCGKEALIYFKNKTKGSLQDAYTLEDMRNFFGKYFLKRNNVTPEFAAQLFKLKKVILGGDERFITKAEIQKMVELVDLLKEQAVLLSPHFPVLIGRKAAPAWSEVNGATDQLGATLWILLKEVDLVNSNYTFTDLKKFFEGLNDFINATEPFYLYEKVNESIAVIEAAKNVIIGEDPRFEGIRDWRDGLNTVLQIYREGLRYKYFIRNNPLEKAEDIDVLMSFIDDGFALVEQSLPMRRHGIISFTSMDILLDRLQDRRSLPMGLSSESLKESYKKIILRLLDPRRQGDPRGLEGFEKSHLVALKQEWMSFRLHQYFINNLPLDAHRTVDRGSIVTAAKQFNAGKYIKVITSNSLEQEALLKSWEQGSKLLQNTNPVIFNDEGRMNVLLKPLEARQSWGSLTRWNLMRALGKAMLLGYGPTGLREQDLVRWYADFEKIGIELKAFDPRGGNSGARSFKEANFFTFSGNGDAVMNAQESFEFVSVLVAGGMSSADGIREDLVKKGCGMKENDIFGFPWLSEPCFKQTLRTEAGRYFDNLPGLVRQIAQMNPAQWDEFYNSLMSSARVSPANGRRVETADLRTAVMMLHYTETLMTVYDKNLNGTLDEDEVKLAAPRFQNFMKSVSPIKENFMVSDFFLYLVFKGQKPGIAEYLLFQAEKTVGSLGEVSRDNILKVFKVLKEEAEKK
jgi:hypothetical protein